MSSIRTEYQWCFKAEACAVFVLIKLYSLCSWEEKLPRTGIINQKPIWTPVNTYTPATSRQSDRDLETPCGTKRWNRVHGPRYRNTNITHASLSPIFSLLSFLSLLLTISCFIFASIES